jgi:cephalosporin hydroxylase
MSFDYCPTLNALYNSREVIGRSGRPFSALNGLSTVNNLHAIRRLLLNAKPGKTLEIGLGCGGSALAFAASHRDLGQPPQRQHIAIDAFQTRIYDDVGRLQLEEAGLSGYVDIRESLSCYELPKIADSGGSFDLVYIDGSHQFEDVFCDFYFVWILTAIGGYILFDDSAYKEVAKVIKHIQKNLSSFFEQIPVHRLSKKRLSAKLKYAVAEKFHKTQLTVFRKIKDKRSLP